MDASDLEEVGALFTYKGEPGWRVRSYCPSPTCDMYNEHTGQVLSFGMGGLTASDFVRVQERARRDGN